jgi:hypothetical protein
MDSDGTRLSTCGEGVSQSRGAEKIVFQLRLDAIASREDPRRSLSSIIQFSATVFGLRREDLILF